MSTPTTQTSKLSVKLAGVALSSEEIGKVIDITVDQDLALPDSFTIRLLDVKDMSSQEQSDRAQMLDDDKFKLGADCEISMGREESAESIIKGLIASIELDLDIDGKAILVVRGYDKSIKMHREKKSRAFLQQKDSDLVGQIAGEHGLSAVKDETTVVHDHVIQDNLTDWEFLRSRAYRVGHDLYVRDTSLYFKKPPAVSSVKTLNFGIELQRVRARLSAPNQVGTVVVRSWDRAAKAAVVGTATAATQSLSNGVSPNTSTGVGNKISSNGKIVVSEVPMDTQSEANLLAKSIYDEMASDLMTLEAVCLGDQLIKPGVWVEIKGVGTRYSGKYYVSAASHRMAPTTGYLCHFTVSGRKPMTLTSLLSGTGGSKSVAIPSPHPGVMAGVVTNIKDDKNQGRVKVKLPVFAGDTELESRWCRVASPMAGASRGMFFLPEVNDEVLVAFEEGDINHPYIVGYLWNNTDKPPKTMADSVDSNSGKAKVRVFKSVAGHEITIDESDQTPGIKIVDKTTNNKIEIDSKNNTMDIKSAGAITIEGKSITIKATNGDVSVNGKNVAVEAQTKFSGKGMQVDFEGTQSAKIKGAMTDVLSDGVLKVKGSVVQIN